MSEDDPVYQRVARCLRRMDSEHNGEMLGAVIALKRELKKKGRCCEDLARWLEGWVETEDALIEVAEAVADEIEDEAREAEGAARLAAAAAAADTLAA
jgi:hypothetical protein